MKQKMIILVADKISQSCLAWLESNDQIELINQPSLSDDGLSDAIQKSQPQVLVVRSTKVNEDALKSGKDCLKLVIRAGAGYDNINLKVASQLGIFVSTCPGKNSVAVAELIMGHIINIDRKISDNVTELRDNKWNKGKFSKARGIKGQVLGLIGFGNIGQQVAVRALSFGMDVIILKNRKNCKIMEDVRYLDDLDEFLKCSDIVSVSVPVTDDTKQMINKQFLEKMKRNGTLINTSRGLIANEDELYEHLRQNDEFNYGTDVFNNEPSAAKSEFQHQLTKLANVYGTHHIGASTSQSENEIGQEVQKIIGCFQQTGRPINVVNIQKNDQLGSGTRCLQIKCLQQRISKVMGIVCGLTIIENEMKTFMGSDMALIKVVVKDQEDIERKMDELADHVGSLDIC